MEGFTRKDRLSLEDKKRNSPRAVRQSSLGSIVASPDVDGFELVGQEEIKSRRMVKRGLRVESIRRLLICNGPHFVRRRIEVGCRCSW
jgi:hypothetical protein